MRKNIYRFILVAAFALMAACSNNAEPSEAEEVEIELDEEGQAEEVEGEDAAGEEGEAGEDAGNEAPTDDVQLEEKQADEEDEELIAQMKEEDGIEDAMAYVTEDGYVLTTFFADESMTKEEAEALAEKYGDKLLSEYPDHIIDIEVMQGDDFLTFVTVEP